MGAFGPGADIEVCYVPQIHGGTISWQGPGMQRDRHTGGAMRSIIRGPTKDGARGHLMHGPTARVLAWRRIAFRPGLVRTLPLHWLSTRHRYLKANSWPDGKTNNTDL